MVFGRKQCVGLNPGWVGVMCSSCIMMSSFGAEGSHELERIGESHAHANSVQSDLVKDRDGVVRHRLDNGMELVLISLDEHRGSDRIELWLSMRAGSVYELEDERGAALIAHELIMDQLGSGDGDNRVLDNRVFDSGRHTGSNFGYEQAMFAGGVGLESEDELTNLYQTIEMIVGFGGVDRSGDEDIENARASLIEHIENEPSAQMRARRSWLPIFFEGTEIGELMPIEQLEHVREIDQSRVRRFIERMYRPAQSTLIVVGDFDQSSMLDELRVQFEGNGKGDNSRGEYRGAHVDGGIKGREIRWVDPDFENDEVALIWVREGEGHDSESWRSRALSYKEEDDRELVLDRIVNEVIRYRLNRLKLDEIGVRGEIRVDQFDLIGDTEVLQIAIEQPDLVWENALGFLRSQLVRLARDGVGESEIDRAREVMLSRWLRDRSGSDSRELWEQIGSYQWAVSSGRPIIDWESWGSNAREIALGISGSEINTRMIELIDPDACSYIVLGSPKVDDSGEPIERFGLHSLDGAMERIDSIAVDPIDEQWMDAFGESLLNDECSGGEIQEVVLHQGSQVWDVSLENGVRLFAREMIESPGEIVMSATLWGGVINELSGDEERIEAALLAWEFPKTSSRSQRSIERYMEEYGLDLKVRNEVGFVQLEVRALSESIERAMELMYVLIDEPMMSEQVFEHWRDEDEHQVDPLDLGINEMMAFSSKLGIGQGEIGLVSARTILARIVGLSQIDVSIVGDIDVEHAIDRAGYYFGSVSPRNDRVDQRSEIDVSSYMLSRKIHRGRVRTDDANEHGIAFGYLGKQGDSIDGIRSIVLGGMILNEQLKGLDTEELKVRAQAVYAGAIGADRVVLLIRAYGDPEQFGVYDEIDLRVDQVFENLLDIEAVQLDLDRVSQRLVESINRYFDRPGYWSRRLGSMRLRDREIDDLWLIREGYQSIEVDQVIGALESILTSDIRFELEMIGLD